jgi:hypothetical protein
VSIPTYRPEDQFQERLNAERLKELFSAKDYQGLLELALLLNHQASFNNSRAVWALCEASKNMSEEFKIEKYMQIVSETLNPED